MVELSIINVHLTELCVSLMKTNDFVRTFIILPLFLGWLPRDFEERFKKTFQHEHYRFFAIWQPYIRTTYESSPQVHCDSMSWQKTAWRLWFACLWPIAILAVKICSLASVSPRLELLESQFQIASKISPPPIPHFAINLLSCYLFFSLANSKRCFDEFHMLTDRGRVNTCFKFNRSWF